MRKAVRELLKQRQQSSEDLLKQVDVKQVGGGRAKDCFNNSVDFAVQNSDRERYKIVSGWLVGEFDREFNGTAIIHHYWNYDTKTKEYIDITPNIDDRDMTYKYVVDTELMAYSQQPHIYEIIDDCVGHSMWYSNGKFSLVTKPFLTQIPVGNCGLGTELFFMDFGGVDKINRALKQMEVA
tara:strand:+ start:52 stop:594 length:543 start_codon:yes stop_codon:yes gene_type:complete